MSHIKAGGVTKGNRDSAPKMLGVKRYGGEKVKPGNILVRQKGTKFHSGEGTRMGGDYTIFAVREGILTFVKKLGQKFLVVK